MIAVSVAAHLGLGVAVFLSGVWKLEQLDGEKPSLGAIGVMMLPSESAGSPPAAVPKVAIEKPKQVVKTLAQIEKVEPVPKKAPSTSDAMPTAGSGDGSGSGSGAGSGSGDGSGSGSGGSCVATSGCTAIAPPPPQPPRVEPPPIVSPPMLQALFLSGERKIHPTDQTKRLMLRDGKKKVTAVIKACIGTTGAVTSATLVSSTKFSDYDARLLEAVRGWRYRPYTVAGRAAAACGMVTFIYSID